MPSKKRFSALLGVVTPWSRQGAVGHDLGYLFVPRGLSTRQISRTAGHVHEPVITCSDGLKIRCSQGREGSNPSSGTTLTRHDAFSTSRRHGPLQTWCKPRRSDRWLNQASTTNAATGMAEVAAACSSGASWSAACAQRAAPNTSGSRRAPSWRHSSAFSRVPSCYHLQD
jgi:hypothetical protein